MFKKNKEASSESSCSSIHIVTLVYGEEYLDFFLNYCLKSMLLAENLPRFCSIFNVSYELYTDNISEHRILTSKKYKQLSKLCKTSFFCINDFMQEQASVNSLYFPYQMMTLSHQKAIQKANKENAAVIFAYPDVYYGANFFLKLVDPIKNGKRSIYISTVRTVKEKIVDQIEEFKNAKKRLGDQSLKEIALNNIFPHERKLIDENLMDPVWSSSIFVRLNKNHFYYRSFHPNLFFIWPRIKTPYNERNTIDNCNYIFDVGIKKNEFYFGNNQEFIFFECSSIDKCSTYLDFRYSTKSLTKYLFWMKRNLNPKQRDFLRIKFTFQLNVKESLLSFKELKYSLFVFLLLSFGKLNSKILKPFLYGAYLNYHSPSKDKKVKVSVASFFRYLFKTTIENYHENEYLKIFNNNLNLINAVFYLKKNQKFIRPYFLVRSLRFIKNCNYSISDEAQFIDFLNTHWKLKHRLLLVLHSSRLKIAKNILEGTLPFIRRERKELSLLGKIYRSGLKYNNIALTDLFIKHNLINKLPLKYCSS